jgi:pimeloyl-ACP methyl ester carboxylesterase
VKEHHVIYVPGLGDKYSYGQDKALKLWKWFGIVSHYHAVGWDDGESFVPKLARLLDMIDDLSNKHTVSLAGASAGASAVLNAYAAKNDRIAGLVSISGKINHPETVGEDLYNENPAFRQSMELLPQNLKQLNQQMRQRIMSIHPLYDTQVPPPDTLIDGAHEKLIWSVGHSFSIGIAITLGAYGICNFLKQQTV